MGWQSHVVIQAIEAQAECLQEVSLAPADVPCSLWLRVGVASIFCLVPSSLTPGSSHELAAVVMRHSQAALLLVFTMKSILLASVSDICDHVNILMAVCCRLRLLVLSGRIVLGGCELWAGLVYCSWLLLLLLQHGYQGP